MSLGILSMLLFFSLTPSAIDYREPNVPLMRAAAWWRKHLVPYNQLLLVWVKNTITWIFILKHKDLATLGFQNNFHTHSLNSTNICAQFLKGRPTLCKTMLPPSTLGWRVLATNLLLLTSPRPDVSNKILKMGRAYKCQQSTFWPGNCWM